jgi:hypothetical protein
MTSVELLFSKAQELMYEFGQVKRLALFDEDALSIDLASRLHNTMMVSQK